MKTLQNRAAAGNQTLPKPEAAHSKGFGPGAHKWDGQKGPNPLIMMGLDRS
ncbi:hypothetical protein [Roseibium denhamense]|uniref:hypothetical protein n=1 Tax=Roseibium denhamense TaxID=76305 RepID=UPI0012BCDCEF|nr:hypothetical protein [Roseibium denhamense]